ncbi:MAG: hypothetical protein ACI4JS_10795 [Oscillospiraceae bacterium]
MTEPLIIPRMESIRETAELFGLPVHFVRCKVASGEVVAVRAGKRFLVNVDKFAEYLNTSTISEAAPRCSGAETTPRISPISLK